MQRVFPGRYTAQIEGPFVVFLIGMRVNKLWALTKWVPVAAAMGPMIRELYANPESGFLSAKTFLTWRGVGVLQYWRSFDHLHAYAHARDARHLPAWTAFNRSVGNNGTVGIWHETYQVQADQYECVYGNMPRWGLAERAVHTPAVGRLQSAMSRMGRDTPNA